METNGGRRVLEMDRDGRSIRVAVELPGGYEFLPDRNHYLMVESSDESVLAPSPIPIDDLAFDWEVPVDVRGEGETTLSLKGMVYFCPASDALVCISAHIDEKHDVRVSAGSGGAIELVHRVEDAEELPGGHLVKRGA
jgi:hypothetical protein